MSPKQASKKTASKKTAPAKEAAAPKAARRAQPRTDDQADPPAKAPASSKPNAPAKKAAAKAAPQKAAGPAPAAPKPPAKRGAAKVAAELIASGDSQGVQQHAAALEDSVERTASNSARVLQEVAEQKPEMVVPIIERFARLLTSDNPRVVQTCASALPPLSRVAPAKVAKQLNTLTGNWEKTNAVGRDGLVRAFAGLCTASVAYQKRLEPALARALRDADPKTLFTWTEVVLPALKGEPHARARAVVEDRLYRIPRPQAQLIADFLGVKLRPLMR